MGTIKNFASLVKISHTVFALPFAFVGFSFAVADKPEAFSVALVLKVLVCMFLARTTAMAFNRYIDREYDARNPRTASREIPAGKVSPRSALMLTIACAVLFVAAAATINTLTFALSPVALLFLLGYSYTKRFTSFCHIVLGICLGIAPVAAYISVTGTTSTVSLLLAILVVLWCGGFDIIYALQDETFDRENGLHSIPVAMGASNALALSSFMHLGAVAMVVMIGKLYISSFVPSLIYWLGTVIFVVLLVYQHLIVKPNDLSRVNLAFGTLNGIASIIYAVFTITALCLL